MSDQLSGSEAAMAIGDPFGTLAGLVAGFVPEGPLRTAVLVSEGLCAALAPFIFKYYLGVLAQGAKPEGSLERRDYDRLRAGLAGDNLAAQLYAKWLTAFLDGVERFFGDAGMADRTLLPRAFGLKTPAPLWTAPAFDRCLFLALVYPIATIFVIWAISGHVGPAESALGLKPEISGWARSILAGAIGLIGFATLRGIRTEGWKSWVWAAFAGAKAVADAADAVVSPIISALVFAAGFTGVLAVGYVVVLAVGYAVVVSAVVSAGGYAVALVVAVAVAAVVAFAGTGAVAVVVAVAVTVALAVLNANTVIFANAAIEANPVATNACIFGDLNIAGAAVGISLLAIKHRRQGVFLSLFLPAMILTCLAGAAYLSSLKSWDTAGSVLLFLGLLTLLNAPFDWASLGLTRALLRRGLELGGWWPYLLALVDAALAGVIIACLALVMVLGVQAFDELAVHGGGKDAAVLPLDALFDGIAKNPAAPEYWWAYALLLSTMIPSLVNLAIGGMALTRGIPGVSRLLLQWIPEEREVPDYRRPLAALVLTGQMFAGAFLGVAAQALLAWGVIFHVMPWIGLDLLGMARAVAAFDVPLLAYQLFAVIL
jgi:hypothetical protein